MDGGQRDRGEDNAVYDMSPRERDGHLDDRISKQRIICLLPLSAIRATAEVSGSRQLSNVETAGIVERLNRTE